MIDFSFAFGGVTFGDGTAIDVINVVGIEDLPHLRTGDTIRSYRDGEISGLDLASGRDITFTLTVKNNGSGFATAVEMLKAATVALQTESLLTFKLAGRPDQAVMCRPRKRTIEMSSSYQLEFVKCVVQFHASDPLVYEAVTSSATASIPAAVTGLAFPAVASFVFGSGGSGGSVVAANSGNFTAPWVAQFVGPLVSPTITHATLGRTIGFNITLAAGDTLTVDSSARTVLLNGTASRYSTLVNGQWFGLTPGTNTVQFNAASGTGTMQLSWRSTWL